MTAILKSVLKCHFAWHGAVSALLRVLQSPEGLGVNKRQTTETLPRSTDIYTSVFLVASGTENAPADELDKH